MRQPLPLCRQSKALVCSRLIAIAGSNLAEGMNVRLLYLSVGYVAASATSGSLVRSPNGCVCGNMCDLGTSTTRRDLGAIFALATQENKSMEHHSI